MSLKDCKEGGLYVHLTYRDEPPPEDDFHWGLYLHRDQMVGGTKYHIKNQGSGWITEHGVTKGVFKSNFLVGLIRIANVSANRLDKADQLIRTYDRGLNDILEVTCREWALKVFKLLKDEGILQCEDLQALNREILDWSNEHRHSAVLAQKPRPFADSQLCKF